MGNIQIKGRRDTTENWEEHDPILQPGETGWDLTLKRRKTGNGLATWSALGWDCLNEDEIQGLIDESIDSFALTVDDIASDLAAEALARTGADTVLQNNLTAHTGNTSNPHGVTLEQARSAGNQVAGDIDMNGHRLRNLPAAVNPDEPVTKLQFDNEVSTIAHNRGAIDCSANPNYPASTVGDRWEVTADGKIGGALGKTVVTWSEVVCSTTNAGGTEAAVGAYFYIVKAPTVQATEGSTGVAALATNAETQAGASDLKIVTPLKLANWWTAIIAAAITFAARITFSTAPRFSTAGASEVLMTNGTKDLTSVAANTAFNQAYGTTTGTVPQIGSTLAASQAVNTDANGKLSTYAIGRRLYYQSRTPVSITVNSTTEELCDIIAIAAPNLVVGDSIEVITCYSRNASNTNHRQKTYLNNAGNLTGATLYKSTIANSASQLTVQQRCIIAIAASSGQKGFGLSTGVFSAEGAGGALVTSTYSIASSLSIINTLQVTTSGDVLTREWVEVYINRA